MWIAIFAAFILVTFTFGQSPHRENSDGSIHRQPTVAEVAEQAEPGLVPRAERRPATSKKD